MPGERILLLMELRVPTGHDPVITLGHRRILSEWKAPKSVGRVRDNFAAAGIKSVRRNT
jgi:hypothetical protein